MWLDMVVVFSWVCWPLDPEDRVRIQKAELIDRKSLDVESMIVTFDTDVTLFKGLLSLSFVVV